MAVPHADNLVVYEDAQLLTIAQNEFGYILHGIKPEGRFTYKELLNYAQTRFIDTNFYRTHRIGKFGQFFPPTNSKAFIIAFIKSRMRYNDKKGIPHVYHLIIHYQIISKAGYPSHDIKFDLPDSQSESDESDRDNDENKHLDRLIRESRTRRELRSHIDGRSLNQAAPEDANEPEEIIDNINNNQAVVIEAVDTTEVGEEDTTQLSPLQNDEELVQLLHLFIIAILLFLIFTA
jgi:hypothetical protein